MYDDSVKTPTGGPNEGLEPTRRNAPRLWFAAGCAVVSYSLAASGGKNRILFSNPDNLNRADGKEEAGKNRDRKNVSVKVSYDEGQTWAVNKTIEPGPSMYSDVAVTKSGTILCFYGRGEKPGFAGESLRLARFNLEWLTDGKDVPANPK